MKVTDYRVNKEINEAMLKVINYRYGTYKCCIYKDLIQLVIHINIEEKEWDFQVIDTDYNMLYAPYYNREYGKNKIIKELDKKIDNIIDELVEAKILIKNGDENNTN